MGLRGPAPKPTVLRELEGYPDHRPAPRDEPQPEKGARCPADLSADAKREWKRLAPILERMKVLTEADVTALANLCRDIVDEQAAAESLKEQGTVRAIADTGFVQVNPLFRIQAELRSRINRALREFGLTPASRTRIRTEVAQRKDEAGVLDGEWAEQPKRRRVKPQPPPALDSIQ